MVNSKVKFIISIGKIGFWRTSMIRAPLKYFGLSLRAVRPLNSPQTPCWMTSRLTFLSNPSAFGSRAGCAIVNCPLALANMGKLRISIVEFLNTAPLVWGFTDGPLTGRYDLSFAVPSQCAEDLKAGRADVGIIPAIEYQRMENVIALPGMAVAAKNEVRSLLVVSKVPIDQAQSFALDTNSRSSVGIARILCSRHWNIAPEFIDMPPDIDAMLARADAALIIGDPALRLRIRLDELEAKVPLSEGFCFGGDDEPLVKGVETM